MNKYNKHKSTAYMVNFLQVFGHWQAILLRLKREKNIKPAVIFQHVCICRDMLGLTNLVLRMWKLSVRLFSKQLGRSRIIIQLIVSFFLKCSKTAGQTTPPPPPQKKEIKLTQASYACYFKDAGELSLFWCFIDTPTQQTSPNLPADALRRAVNDLRGGEVKEGRAWAPPIHYHRLKRIKKKVKSYRLFDFLCCVDSSGTDIHLVYIHTSEADRTERTGKLINTS